MRLKAKEAKAIISAFKEVFGHGKLYLFGSRLDDSKKGGDIDLYLCPIDHSDLQKKKASFLVKLDDVLGEQKIDIVFDMDSNRNIEEIAMYHGLELNEEKLRLNKYLYECGRHEQRMNEAYEDIRSFIPLSAEEYTMLNKNQIQALDQYLFRFSKLQDTLGDKVLRLIVSFYVEDVDNIPFKDMLNRLEKIGYLYDANEWMILRKIRNNISHQYDDEPDEMSKAINEIVISKDVLLKIYNRIKLKCKEDLDV